MLVCESMCLSPPVCLCMHMDICTALSECELSRVGLLACVCVCVCVCVRETERERDAHTRRDAGVKQMTCHVCLPGSASSLVTNQNPITASILAY